MIKNTPQVCLGLALIGLLQVPSVANANCSVTANGLIFGSYDVFDSSHNDSTGTINVTCSIETSYTLKLSQGNGSFSERTMESAGQFLSYNIYTDPGRSIVWGDGSSGSATQSGSTNATVQYNVYGRIPARQNKRVGAYQDSLIVTLEF